MAGKHGHSEKTWRLDWENQRNPEISRGYTIHPTSRLADQKKLRAPPPRSSVGLPTGAAAELLPIQHGHMYLMAELIMYICIYMIVHVVMYLLCTMYINSVHFIPQTV